MCCQPYCFATPGRGGRISRSRLCKRMTGQNDVAAIAAAHPELGSFSLYCDGTPPLLFTENETNNERIFGTPNASPYVKDGINDYVVAGRQEAVNPNQTGTKAAAHYQVEVGGGQTAVDPAAVDQCRF